MTAGQKRRFDRLPFTLPIDASPSITNELLRLRRVASGDQRIVTVAGLQALAVALDDQAVAVVLDIANPFQAVRDFGLGARHAGF